MQIKTLETHIEIWKTLLFVALNVALAPLCVGQDVVWCHYQQICLVIGLDDMQCIDWDVRESISCNVNEIEFSLHVSGHVARIAR